MRIISAVLWVFFILITSARAEVILNQPQWKSYFDDFSEDGTFVLKRIDSDTLLVYNSQRAKSSFLPASTYKIIHSLIALETGVVKNPADTIYWDGKIRQVNSWNQNQTLATAFKYSAVWVYQEFAPKIGPYRMQFWVDTCDYGNRNIGGNLSTFWLNGDVRISAIEQIYFLEKFYHQKLPFNKQHQEIVKQLMLIKETENFKIYAKTGWAVRVEKQIGWYVGFVENDRGTWLFALNMDISKKGNQRGRELITRKILTSEKILK